MILDKKNIFFLLFFFHIALSSLVHFVAHSNYLTWLHNGQGYWWLAGDAIRYQQEALIQLEYLKNSDWLDWAMSFNNHFNVKIISLTYWISGTSSPLSLSITNALIWIFSIILVFKSTKLIFPKNIFLPFFTSLFFFQPSILFQSTQMLRDPYLILGICFFIYGWIILEKNNSKWQWLFYMLLGFIFTVTMRQYLFPMFALPTLVYSAWLLYHKRWMLFPFVTLLILLGVFQFSYDNNRAGNIVNKITTVDNFINNNLENEHQIKMMNEELNFVKIAYKEKIVFENNAIEFQETLGRELINQKNFERKSVEQKKIYEKNLAEQKVLEQRIEEVSLVKQQAIDKDIDEFKAQLMEELLRVKKVTALYQKNLLENEVIRLQKAESIETFLNQKIIMENERKRLEGVWEYMNNLDAVIQFPDVVPSDSRIMNVLNVISHHIGAIRYDFHRAVSPAEIFLVYQVQELGPGSSIDSDIVIYDFNSLIRYLPRAIQIALFAPFPNSWSDTGNAVGKIGRIISGVEMFLWYFILIGFSYSLIYNFSIFRQLLPVFIFSVAITILLAYVVPVVGALFRMRQGYMIPFYIFGTYGLTIIYSRLFRKFERHIHVK